MQDVVAWKEGVDWRGRFWDKVECCSVVSYVLHMARVECSVCGLVDTSF